MLRRILSRLLAFVVVFIALVPVSVITTILAAPLLVWAEKAQQIELVGHSGPSVASYLSVYLVYVILVLCLYRFILALALLAVFLIILVLFMPLPHGGSIGEGLLHELAEALAHLDEYSLPEQQPLAEENLPPSIAQRFSRIMPFDPLSIHDHWLYGLVEGGGTAWLDRQSGMIWGGRETIVLQGWSQQDLQQAISICRKKPPQGLWSLATNAEYALAVKSDMHKYIPDNAGKWIAQSVVLGTLMPSVVGFSTNSSNYAPHSSTVKYIRCVSRSETAPERGYTRNDITNADVLHLLNR